MTDWERCKTNIKPPSKKASPVTGMVLGADGVESSGMVCTRCCVQLFGSEKLACFISQFTLSALFIVSVAIIGTTDFTDYTDFYHGQSEVETRVIINDNLCHR